MFVFFVIGDSPELKAKVESEYPEHHEKFTGGWIVAADKVTTSDVAASLGMNSADKISGIVVNPDAYNGWYSNSLWEKLSLWRDEIG